MVSPNWRANQHSGHDTPPCEIIVTMLCVAHLQDNLIIVTTTYEPHFRKLALWAIHAPFCQTELSAHWVYHFVTLSNYFGTSVLHFHVWSEVGWSQFQNCSIQTLGCPKKLETWPKLTLKLILGGWPQNLLATSPSGSCGGQISWIRYNSTSRWDGKLIWAQKMRKKQVSISDKRKILPYFILKKLLLKNCFSHHFPINRKDNE